MPPSKFAPVEEFHYEFNTSLEANAERINDHV
jgi:hypothetical protein